MTFLAPAALALIGAIAAALNLSARGGGALLARLDQLLAEHPIDPSRLELEITETALVDDVVRSKTVLADLKELGVHVALDDFGIGYSSLNYLQGLPLDTLKIDRAFTTDVAANDKNASIVRATLALARGLHLKTVAEGVETPAQARFLVAEGCDMLQGFLFSKPLPAADFQAFALASHTYLLSRKIS